jgi:hypothetical protein
MKLSEVIEHLQNQLAEKGDVKVYVNGEFGQSEPVEAHKSHFLTDGLLFAWGGDLDELPVGVRVSESIMQIGGY